MMHCRQAVTISLQLMLLTVREAETMPNNERILDRIDALCEYLQGFPQGPIADAARHELEHLEQLTQEYGI